MSDGGHGSKPNGVCKVLPAAVPEELSSAARHQRHPLFPREGAGPELPEIRFLSFRRKLPNGGIEHCPEDIPADEIQSWDDVVRLWGGGEYQAIGKNELGSIVAWYPPLERPWMRFEQEPRPFMPSSAACGLADTAPPPPPPPEAPPLRAPAEELAAWIAVHAEMTRATTGEVKAQREIIAAQGGLIRAQHDLVVELLKELSELRTERRLRPAPKKGAAREVGERQRSPRTRSRRKLG
jgi:hypothetical protein